MAGEFSINDLIKKMKSYQESYNDTNYKSNKRLEKEMNKLLNNKNLDFDNLKLDDARKLFGTTEKFLEKFAKFKVYQNDQRTGACIKKSTIVDKLIKYGILTCQKFRDKDKALEEVRINVYFENFLKIESIKKTFPSGSLLGMRFWVNLAKLLVRAKEISKDFNGLGIDKLSDLQEWALDELYDVTGNIKFDDLDKSVKFCIIELLNDLGKKIIKEHEDKNKKKEHEDKNKKEEHEDKNKKEEPYKDAKKFLRVLNLIGQNNNNKLKQVIDDINRIVKEDNKNGKVGETSKKLTLTKEDVLLFIDKALEFISKNLQDVDSKDIQKIKKYRGKILKLGLEISIFLKPADCYGKHSAENYIKQIFDSNRIAGITNKHIKNYISNFIKNVSDKLYDTEKLGSTELDIISCLRLIKKCIGK